MRSRAPYVALIGNGSEYAPHYEQERERTQLSPPARDIPLQMLAFPTTAKCIDASSLCKIEGKRSSQGAYWNAVEGGKTVPGRSGCADHLTCESTHLSLRRKVVDNILAFKDLRCCENTSSRRKIESSRVLSTCLLAGVLLAEERGYSSRKDTYRNLCEEGKGIHVIQWARNSPRIHMRVPLPLGPPLQRGFARAKKSGLDFEPFGGQNDWLK